MTSVGKEWTASQKMGTGANCLNVKKKRTSSRKSESPTKGAGGMRSLDTKWVKKKNVKIKAAGAPAKGKQGPSY